MKEKLTKKLCLCAHLLDKKGLSKEADRLTKVLVKLAQEGSVEYFDPNNSFNILKDIETHERQEQINWNTEQQYNWLEKAPMNALSLMRKGLINSRTDFDEFHALLHDAYMHAVNKLEEAESTGDMETIKNAQEQKNGAYWVLHRLEEDHSRNESMFNPELFPDFFDNTGQNLESNKVSPYGRRNTKIKR